MSEPEAHVLHTYSGDLFNTRSAEAVLPLLFELLGEDVTVRSAVDVGCGIGTWLAVSGNLGVRELLGLDGDHVDREALVMDVDRFVACDLTQPQDLGRRFDLAFCLEVGEHLPPEAADGLVELLTALSDRVLFSAALPGQGGQQHLNEQWPAYWAEKFREKGYRCHDTLRQRIWENDQVEWWYRQNLLLFLRDGVAPALEGSAPPPLVHPGCLKRARERHRQAVRRKSGIRGVTRELGSMARRLIRNPKPEIRNSK